MSVAKVAALESNGNGAEKSAPLQVRIREYFEELRGEMQRVSWPTWEQVRITTGIVIAAVVLFAVYFSVVDFLVGQSIQRIFQTFAK